MNPTERPIRAILIADAAVGLLTGAGMLLSTPFYVGLTALPAELLRWAGMLLFGYVAALTVAALLRPLRRSLVVGIVVANGAWVVASLVVLATVAMSPFGAVYVAGQALVVVGFGVAEAVAVRRVQD